ncbi:MAG: hypothetical protein KDK30_13480 [Leptospiraceae bacterium]|nr:hypothetical protein [Leptospiraceae bacterium]MCB1316128.1 hypothetical protein [Leptospiraceae bacterium]MCB1321973.1 hypothetical protein [Leptospiraceae bacterium]
MREKINHRNLLRDYRNLAVNYRVKKGIIIFGSIAMSLLGWLALLIGLMAFYGRGNYLPLNPEADRHPPSEQLLRDIQRGFSRYPDFNGSTFAIGRAVMEKYNLAYLEIETAEGATLHKSYDPGRIRRERLEDMLQTVNRRNAISAEPHRLGEFYYQRHTLAVPLTDEEISTLTITYIYEKIYIGHRKFANLFGVPHFFSRLFRVQFDHNAFPVAGGLILIGLSLVCFSFVKFRRTVRAARIIRIKGEVWPDPNRPLPEVEVVRGYDRSGNWIGQDSADEGEEALYNADGTPRLPEEFEQFDADRADEWTDEYDSAPVRERSRRQQQRLFHARVGDRVRIHGIPDDFLKSDAVHAPEQEAVADYLHQRKGLQAGREAYEFEQERWSLPGFQSVMHPLRRRIQAEEMDFTDRHYAHHGQGEGFDNASSLFDFRYYRFYENTDYPANISDLESFARSFLQTVIDRLGPSDATLFLRNRRRQFHPVLRKTGNVFISGAALHANPETHADHSVEQDHPDAADSISGKDQSRKYKLRSTPPGHRPHDDNRVPDAVIRQLEKENFVVLEEGRLLYFPLPSRQGMLGLLRFRSERPLYNQKALAATWYEIRKFGESLFQARVFEEATVDAESTLANGMCFARDLKNDFALRTDVRFTRELILMRFHGRSNPEAVRLYGLALRAYFPYPMRLYRVAADVFAVIAAEIPESELERTIGEYLAYVREDSAVDITVGCALLDEDVISPDDWFGRAGLALEEAARDGLNRYQIYTPAGEAVHFRTQ